MFQSRPLLIPAFLSVAAAANLQFLGAHAQADAFRSHTSRLEMVDLQNLLVRLESAADEDRADAAKEISSRAELLRRLAGNESISSASRRVASLASWEVRATVENAAIRERLRAELAGVLATAEKREVAALTRSAEFHFWTNLALWSATLLFGLCAIPRRVRASASLRAHP